MDRFNTTKPMRSNLRCKNMSEVILVCVRHSQQSIIPLLRWLPLVPNVSSAQLGQVSAQNYTVWSPAAKQTLPMTAKRWNQHQIVSHYDQPKPWRARHMYGIVERNLSVGHSIKHNITEARKWNLSSIIQLRSKAHRNLISTHSAFSGR